MKKVIIVSLFCITSIMGGCFLFNDTAESKDPRGELYAGSGACAKCHSNISNSYLHTAHYLASLPATEKTVHGSFEKGFNAFKVKEGQKVIMEKHDSSLFQTYYLNGRVKERYRFDIVLGGIKGESYFSWKGNELYQLPLSFYSAQQQWSTSPGYSFDFLKKPNLRSIGKRCMECHASYIGNVSGQSPGFNKAEQFDKSTLVFSVDCERCHGPAKQHVRFQTENPQAKTAKFITAYHSLSRSQKVDMCAVCHSGNPNVMLRSTFEFRPGDVYAKFKIPEFSQEVKTANLDVHGNQVQLLESSKCYISSKMDCGTCHNPHHNNRGDNEFFTLKCFGCHNTPSHTYCKMTDKLSTDLLKTKCISCHMPALTSKAISVQLSDTMPAIRFSVHTHRIAIYPEEVKKILAYINK